MQTYIVCITVFIIKNKYRDTMFLAILSIPMQAPKFLPEALQLVKW